MRREERGGDEEERRREKTGKRRKKECSTRRCGIKEYVAMDCSHKGLSSLLYLSFFHSIRIRCLFFPPKGRPQSALLCVWRPGHRPPSRVLPSFSFFLFSLLHDLSSRVVELLLSKKVTVCHLWEALLVVFFSSFFLVNV